MKYLIILLFAAGGIYSAPPDSNVFKLFPLKTGNSWTWSNFSNVGPSSYESIVIIGTELHNGKIYNKGRKSFRYTHNPVPDISYVYYRIDSITGNLYRLNENLNGECFLDSLNGQSLDSARVTCGFGWQQGWNRYSSEQFIIFSQNYPSKKSTWSNYFEGGGYTNYVTGMGRVKTYSFSNMNFSISQLQGCIINGMLLGDTSIFVGINYISSEAPQSFSLSQNYPNPFNPTTNIKFDVPKAGFIRLTVFDVLGKEIQKLVNEHLSPGTYNFDFDASHLPSGVYYYKLEVNNFIQTKKMVLIK